MGLLVFSVWGLLLLTLKQVIYLGVTLWNLCWSIIQVQISFVFKYRVPYCYYHHHHRITVKPHYFTGLGSKKYGLELCSSELSDIAVHTFLLHGWLKHLRYVAMCDFFPDLVLWRTHSCIYFQHLRFTSECKPAKIVSCLSNFYHIHYFLQMILILPMSHGCPVWKKNLCKLSRK